MTDQAAKTYEIPTTLFDYRKIELNTVADLTRLKAIAEKVGLEPEAIDLIDSALARNKEQKFSIAVVGEFKRGKSTFINALLGKEILPSDILPCSATLNRVTYGLEPAAEIRYKSVDGLPGRVEKIEIEELQDYVTKLTPESEQRASGVQEAIVYYPLPSLKNNVDIIDTPGLNDDAEMTRVTLGVLPQTSAAILVIMATAPFSASEADFLNNQLLLNDLGRIIFVVTGIDLIRREKDRERLIDSIRSRIETAVDNQLTSQFKPESDDYKMYRKQIGPPIIFPISGIDALEAKEGKDDELLEESGFPVLETSLEKFLTETRGAVELQTLANRIVTSGNQIQQVVKLEINALQMSQEEFDEKYKSAMADLDALLQRRDKEMVQVDTAAKQTRKKLNNILSEFPNKIKEVVINTIDQKEMKGPDIKNDAFIESLNREITDGIKQVNKKMADRLQIEMERDLVAEAERLEDFTRQVGEVLHKVDMNFGNVEATRSGENDGMTAVLGGVAGGLVGGIYSGYQAAGGKGAAVGGLVGAGTFAGGYVALAAIGIASFPVALASVIALGIASAFTGKWVTLRLFDTDRVEKFKLTYKEQVLSQIDDQLKTQRLDIELNQQIANTYNALKERVGGEIDATLKQTRSKLEQLRDQKASQATLSEHRQNELNELMDEVQTFRSRAQALSNQLVEIKSV